MSCIVAIAGPAGCGKSELIAALLRRLPSAAALHFDNYEHATLQSADELTAWLRRGADFNEFAVPRLVEELAELRRTDDSPRVVLFEMPLGREHAETATYIDLLIWIDVPADVALARKVRQFVHNAARHEAPGEHRHFVAWLDLYLGNYLRVVREVYLVQETKVRPRADVIVNGLEPVEVLADQVLTAVLHALPAR